MSQNKILNRVQVGYILKRYHIKITGNYEIRADGLLDVNGSINISGSNLFKIPLKFNRVTGDFHCKSNALKTLKGCPKFVGGTFDCSDNELTTLEGGPDYVRGSYNCCENKLITLKGCAKEVGRDFLCNDNLLESLVGSPGKIEGYFNCKLNKIKSLVGCPKELYGRFHVSHNRLNNFLGAPEKMWGEIYCTSNYLENLKGLPIDFEGQLFIDSSAKSLNCGDDDYKKMKLQLRILDRFGHNFMPKQILTHHMHISLIMRFQRYYEIWTSENELDASNFDGLIEDILDGLE
jgi:hypothetical protein